MRTTARATSRLRDPAAIAAFAKISGRVDVLSTAPQVPSGTVREWSCRMELCALNVCDVPHDSNSFRECSRRRPARSQHSSFAGWSRVPNRCAYCATKAAASGSPKPYRGFVARVVRCNPSARHRTRRRFSAAARHGRLAKRAPIRSAATHRTARQAEEIAGWAALASDDPDSRPSDPVDCGWMINTWGHSVGPVGPTSRTRDVPIFLQLYDCPSSVGPS